MIQMGVGQKDRIRFGFAGQEIIKKRLRQIILFAVSCRERQRQSCINDNAGLSAYYFDARTANLPGTSMDNQFHGISFFFRKSCTIHGSTEKHFGGALFGPRLPDIVNCFL